MGTSATTQTYRVETIYEVVDKTSRAVGEIEKATKRAAESTQNLTSSVKALGMAFVGSHAVKLATESFIGFNKEVQNVKIGLTAMIQGNFGSSMEAARGAADRLYQEFQRFSTQTPVTTQEITEFGKSVAVATFQAGGGVKDLIKITEQGVIAAKAFGYGSAYSALELSEMLSGNVNKRMMFAKQLLGLAKMDEHEFKALSSEKRMAVVEKVLDSQAMRDAAKNFGESFSGVTSTFQDKLQIALGRVGLPLFKAITAEVARWNEWIDKNEFKLEQFAKSAGQTLVSAFGAVKKALEFIYDHADTLIAIGKVWAMVKIGGWLGGLSMGSGGAVGQAFGGAMTSMVDKVGAGVKLGLQKFALSAALHGAPGVGSIIGGAMTAGSAIGRGMSSIGSVLGGLGPAGVLGIGMGAYELSKAIGLDQFVRDAVNPAGAALRRAKEGVEAFDLSLQNAQKSVVNRFGAAGSGVAGGYAKSQSDYAKEIAALNDTIRFLGTDQGFLAETAMKAPGAGGRRGVARDRLREQLAGTGMTDTDIDQFMNLGIEGQRAYISGLEGRRASSNAMQKQAVFETTADVTRYSMTEEMKGLRGDTTYWNKVNNFVLVKMMEALQQGHVLDYAEVVKLIKEMDANDPDAQFRKHAATNQNIKITINQMMAKDPHRWLTEMEDEIAKRNRAPTRAKQSWKNSPR